MAQTKSRARHVLAVYCMPWLRRIFRFGSLHLFRDEAGRYVLRWRDGQFHTLARVRARGHAATEPLCRDSRFGSDETPASVARR
jgi:hypothetical protein